MIGGKSKKIAVWAGIHTNRNSNSSVLTKFNCNFDGLSTQATASVGEFGNFGSDRRVQSVSAKEEKVHSGLKICAQK